MLHSIESCKYLQLESDNFLKYDSSEPGVHTITIMQEYERHDIEGACLAVEPLYNVKIEEIALRELILFQSICFVNRLGDLLDIIND